MEVTDSQIYLAAVVLLVLAIGAGITLVDGWRRK